jgi:hypothetical protein
VSCGSFWSAPGIFLLADGPECDALLVQTTSSRIGRSHEFLYMSTQTNGWRENASLLDKQGERSFLVSSSCGILLEQDIK